MGILRTTGFKKRKDFLRTTGSQLGAQQVGTNSVAISIQGMLPFGHHTMLLLKVDEVVRLTEIWMAWPPFPYSLI
jgi:hypothetical protein